MKSYRNLSLFPRVRDSLSPVRNPEKTSVPEPMRHALCHATALVLALACVFCSRALSREYYFSASGRDRNPGTRELPLRTMSALSNIQLMPGDSMLLRGGDTFTGTMKIHAQGNETMPVIISSYGTGRATINGEGSVAMVISGKWFHLKDIDARGAGRKSGNTTHGVSIYDTEHAVVSGIRVERFQKSGLSVYRSDSVEVNDVHAIHNGAIGISVFESQRIHVFNCLAENNPGDPTKLDNHSGNGILVGESKVITIDHCVATNNGWDMPRTGNGPVGIWAYQSDQVIIEYCIAYRNRTSPGAKDGGGFDFDGGVTNSVIRYCLSYENDGAGIGLFQYPGADPWKDNTICYNISINDGIETDGAGGIFIWNGGPTTEELADCYVFNNVVFNESKPAVVFEPSSAHSKFVFFNNIFLSNGDIVSGPTSGDRFLGNVWWHASEGKSTFRGYDSLEAWSDATGQEIYAGILRGSQTDPLFKGPPYTSITDPYRLERLVGFRLSENSPVKDKGIAPASVNAPVIPTSDFFGKPVPQGSGLEPGIHEISE